MVEKSHGINFIINSKIRTGLIRYNLHFLKSVLLSDVWRVRNVIVFLKESLVVLHLL